MFCLRGWLIRRKIYLCFFLGGSLVIVFRSLIVCAILNEYSSSENENSAQEKSHFVSFSCEDHGAEFLLVSIIMISHFAPI